MRRITPSAHPPCGLETDKVGAEQVTTVNRTKRWKGQADLPRSCLNAFAASQRIPQP